MGTYDDIFRASVDDPERFWLDAARTIDWSRSRRTALDASRPPFYRWFPDGELNVCHNALDRHVDGGRGEQAGADLRLAGHRHPRARYTYAELRDEVARFAGVLTELGVQAGDRVVIYMPMVPEAAVAMLACARIGAVHSVVFGGFAPKELAVRIDDAAPTVIVSASCGIEGERVIEYKPLLDRAIELATPPAGGDGHPAAPAGHGRDGRRTTSTGPRPMAAAEPVDCVPVQATDPLYILYTSGTTGKPKGVVRDGGGYAVALAWSMPNVYDVGAGETMFTASDVGWVVGHSYIVYAPLLAGATTVLYEGKPVGTPDAGQFWRVIAEHGVKSMFTAPDRVPGDQEGGPEGRARRPLRPVRAALPVPGRRAAGPGDLPLGVGPAGHPGDRPLVADRDRLADRGQPGRHRAAADQARLAHPTAARLGRAGAGHRSGGR